MDKFRAKKRGFFAISNSLSSSGDKKRNKGDKHEFIYLKGEKPECSNFEGEKLELNKVSADSDGETDDEMEQGDISGQSTSEPETAVSGSSCDDIHKASRKLQAIAKKSIRRDKKKEKEKQERKEKNKLSMDDFLSKQIEFITWLEEEKHKNSKEMSSPKRKAYFKTFLKLWNKRKLPQKYYRGSAEIQSPCPAHPTRTFSFEDEEVVSFTRPKSKRLSIEPWGPPDSPFSTFGKTPPKSQQTPNLALLESQTSLELGDYQTPKNALPMGGAGQSVFRSESSHEIQRFPAGELPGTPASAVLEKSPVYAVPWKPKPTPRKKPPVVEKIITSPSPPPIPPKSFQNGEEDEVIEQTVQNQPASETKTVSQPGSVNDCGQETCGGLRVSETCSTMEVDEDNRVGQAISKEDGWHNAIVGKPFSPTVKIRKTFFPQEQIYAEIDSLEMKSAPDKESTQDLETDDHFSAASAHELHALNTKLQSDSSTIASYPDSKVKPLVLENLQTTRENRFSFSKYLITPEKRAATPKKKKLTSQDSKEHVPKKCLEKQNEFPSLEKESIDKKEKPEIMPRNIPKLRSDFKVTMTIRNGLHNVRNFVIEENKQARLKENKDDDPARRQLQKVKQKGKREKHPAVSESRLETGEKFSLSVDGSRNPKSKLRTGFLETDIDSSPLPIMGAKTPPRQRKPLSNIQRSKSLETIIW